MKRFFVLLCIILFVCSYGIANGLIILSPSIPEEELKGRVHESLSDKPQSKEKEGLSPSENKLMIENTSLEKPAENSDSTQEALINLLEKKGIITKKELLDEIKKLKDGLK